MSRMNKEFISGVRNSTFSIRIQKPREILTWFFYSLQNMWRYFRKHIAVSFQTIDRLIHMCDMLK